MTIDKDKVWDKGREIRGKNPDAWRRDSKGNKIRYGSYGTIGDFGWEIDHKKPKAQGGSDAINNLQPLQWKTNRKKSDN